MESVGKILAEARIAKGLSLERVAEEVSIRPAYLEALEKDDYSKLPEEVFIKGFIRNYGNYLGLKGPELVDLYKANKAGAPVETVKSPSVREVDRVKLNISLKQKRDIGSGTGGFSLPHIQLPWRQLALGVVAVAILAGGYFAVPAVMDTLSDLPSVSLTEKQDPVEQAQPVQQGKVYDHVVVEMTASGECWLEVYENNKEVFAGMLYAQDHKVFEAQRQLVVKYGSVGVMQVTFNGEPQDMKGEQGVVVKTYNF